MFEQAGVISNRQPAGDKSTGRDNGAARKLFGKGHQ
jgi:hypothetical protein